MVASRDNSSTVVIKQSSACRVLDGDAIWALWQRYFHAAKRAGLAVAGGVVVPI